MKEWNVIISFLEPTPVRTAVRQTSRWRVHFNIFLDIPEHPGQPGAVTTQGNCPVVHVVSGQIQISKIIYISFDKKKKPGRDCLKVKKSENNPVDSWKVEGQLKQISLKLPF